MKNENISVELGFKTGLMVGLGVATAQVIVGLANFAAFYFVTLLTR
jgi:lipoate synthase